MSAVWLRMHFSSCVFQRVVPLADDLAESATELGDLRVHVGCSPLRSSFTLAHDAVHRPAAVVPSPICRLLEQPVAGAAQLLLVHPAPSRSTLGSLELTQMAPVTRCWGTMKGVGALVRGLTPLVTCSPGGDVTAGGASLGGLSKRPSGLPRAAPQAASSPSHQHHATAAQGLVTPGVRFLQAEPTNF